MIAQGLAALHPERVAALVLSDTAHKIGTEASWNERIDAVTADGIAAIADTIMQRWFTPAYRQADNPDFAGYTAMLTRTPVDGYVGTCAALRDADLTESTRALKMPALCIVGDQDGATPPDLVRSMADLIRNSEFRIIPDAGHIAVHRAAGRGGRPDRQRSSETPATAEHDRLPGRRHAKSFRRLALPRWLSSNGLAGKWRASLDNRAMTE